MQDVDVDPMTYGIEGEEEAHWDDLLRGIEEDEVVGAVELLQPRCVLDERARDFFSRAKNDFPVDGFLKFRKGLELLRDLQTGV